MTRLIDLANIPSTYEQTTDFTPSLAAQDDAQALMRKEWNRNEPSEDIPRQYSTPCGHLTPTQPRQDYMMMDSTLNITHEGSMNDILTTCREDTSLTEARQPLRIPKQGRIDDHPAATAETQDTSIKVLLGRTPDEQSLRTSRLIDEPRRIQHTREASQEDALASARHFFAHENGQEQAVRV